MTARMIWMGLLLGLCLTAQAHGQQPFYTDDADVTPPRKFHFEFHNEFDTLQRSAFPNLRQNTASFELNYGLLEGIELGIEAPLLTIFNDRTSRPRHVTGIGDTHLAVKYNFRKERDNSSWPALTVNAHLELPTGDADCQLGSGVTDVWLNFIAQKSLTDRTTLRVNQGLVFAGNTATGVLGLQTDGLVYTGGVSLVRKFTARLQLGAEMTGALAQKCDMGRGQLQLLVGGDYELKQGLALDFGVLGGRFTGSPRVGVQLGVSIDF